MGERELQAIPKWFGPSNNARPMTSKQARKEYLERTRGPKLSKEEQRRQERELQAEIRREIKQRDEEEKKALERQRAQARAKLQRDKQKAKDEAEKLAKRKAGKPLKPPRPSQASIMSFMRGGTTSKKHPASEDIEESKAIISEEAVDTPACSQKRRKLSNDHDPQSLATHVSSPVKVAQQTISAANDHAPLDEPAVCLKPGGAPSPRRSSPSPPEQAIHAAMPSYQGMSKTVNAVGGAVMRIGLPIPAPEIIGQHEAEQTTRPSPAPVPALPNEIDAQELNPVISFSLDDFEDFLPSGTQLDEELRDLEDEMGSQATVVETTRDLVAEDQGDQGPQDHTTGLEPTLDLNIANMLPFLSTQDCALSVDDIAEIETPSHAVLRNAPHTSPHQHPITCSRVAPRTPTMQPPPQDIISAERPALVSHSQRTHINPPSRPPLAPITNMTHLALNPPPSNTTKGQGLNLTHQSSTANPGLAIKMTAEDLSVLQSIDWDDDLDVENRRSPKTTPCRRTVGVTSPEARLKSARSPLRPSSSDLRALTCIDWSDDEV